MKKSKGLLEEYSACSGREKIHLPCLLIWLILVWKYPKKSCAVFLEDFTPLGMCCNVVFLDWNSHMDTHCYLDQNSCLSVPEFGDAGGVVLSENYILG